jgi:hypothetical protein
MCAGLVKILENIWVMLCKNQAILIVLSCQLSYNYDYIGQIRNCKHLNFVIRKYI